MKRSGLIVAHGLTAVVTAGLIVGLGAGRPSTQPDPNMDPAKMQAMMADYMKSIQPSDRHKVLERMVGDWTVTTKMFMAPGAPPTETTGTAHNELVHGGRFIKTETTGKMSMPGPDGKMIDIPMNGLGLFGHDNHRRLYTMAWTSSMSTAVLTASGGLSQDGKSLTLFGEMDEPLTGEVGKAVKYAIKFVDTDKYVLEISEVIYGEAFRVVEVTHVRKAKAATPVEK